MRLDDFAARIDQGAELECVAARAAGEHIVGRTFGQGLVDAADGAYRLGRVGLSGIAI